MFVKHNIFHSFAEGPLFHVKETDTKALLNIVTQLQAEMWTPIQFAHAEYPKVLLHLFLIVIQRFGVRKDCNGLNMNNPSHILFVKFRKLLEENYRLVRTVAGYASLLNVSAKPLTNCTNEIGYDLGFEDPSYFVKFFKRYMKMLPGEFRSKM